MQYSIVTDGSCDLPPALTRQLGISVVPFYVSFDDKTYKKEMVDVDIRDFYEEMVSRPGEYPKSSMPTAPDFVAAFTPLVAAGQAVLCLCITSKFSGSMHSALLARDMVLEQYPDARITVMDTTINTVLQGIFVLEAAKLRQADIPFAETVARLEEMRATGRIFFTVGSLDYLQHGGRLGKAATKVASILNVKPMITLREGEIFSAGIARGRAASLAKVQQMLQAYLKETGKPLRAYSLCIGCGYDREEAREFRKMLMKTFDVADKSEIPIYQIGATIAVHTGPYPLGVAIVEKALPL